jgi:hypothetical protein
LLIPALRMITISLSAFSRLIDEQHGDESSDGQQERNQSGNSNTRNFSARPIDRPRLTMTSSRAATGLSEWRGSAGHGHGCRHGHLANDVESQALHCGA